MSEHLFDLDELNAPLATVSVDPRRQHISLITDEAWAGAFVDLGCELHWWSQMALHLDAVGARQLGEALIVWADRHEGRATT